MSIGRISGYWMVVIGMTAGAALLAHFGGKDLHLPSWLGPERIILAGVCLLVFRAQLTAAWRFVERYAPRRSADQHDRDSKARVGAQHKDGPVHLNADRRDNLKQSLRTRHGLRWRYRDRWILLTGDVPLVTRLAPGLTATGYAITGNTVLLYANQTRDKLDTDWLDQIRRLRRRRPVDAIVAVTRNRTIVKGAPTTPAFDTDDIAQRLARHARALRWAAPVYLINVTDFGSEPSESDEPIGFTWSNPCADADQIANSLQNLVGSLADAGVERLADNKKDRYPAELSKHVGVLRGELSKLVVQTGQSGYPRSAVHGLLFAELYKKRELEPAAVAGDGDEDEAAEPAESAASTQRTVWRTVSDHSRQLHGRHVGFSLSVAAAWTSIALIALWTAGMMTSGFANHASVTSASRTLAQLTRTSDPTRAAQALDALDSQLDTLEVRRHDGAPWYTRFGLNRDAALYAALWPAHVDASARILVAPIRARLEDRLRQLASLSDAEIASGGADQVKAAYAALKTYLMLARPEHADAAFLTPQLLDTASPARPVNSPLTEGGWLDLRRRLITFFAAHLGKRIDGTNLPPAIIADATLVAATRQTVIGVIGLQNSTDALYQQILDEARPKYPPVSLAGLLGNTVQPGSATGVGSRGLFGTTSTVPGVFTREAWDERISKSIDEASTGHGVAGDWVLSDTRALSPDRSALKAELRQRYFDDYARAWEQFLNTLRWQPAESLSGTVDQLTLLSDPQRSPLVGLMKAVIWQADAGVATQSLSDSLISKAKQLTGNDGKNPSKMASNVPDAPLAAAFGPILRLAGSDTGNVGESRAGAAMATGDLSLPRYIERVSAMRLKLQQIMLAPDPNATSRVAAQAVLQGRVSDIADSREYGSRVAASLGQQWAGFGELFEAPLEQTWRVVLQPAAASLNETWRNAIVADWNRTFGGRYPFADSDNDASLPEMARFMRPDTGVIAQFMASQLAGIVERQGDRWVPVQDTGHSGLTIAPGFLSTINRLMRVSTVLFPSGDAQVRFDLRGVATPGITDTRLVLNGRALGYFNQKEEWVSFVWPDATLDGRSHIEWQSEESGLRSSLDAQGRFGPIRLLEKARVEQQDNARYLLNWTPDRSRGIALRVQLRSEAGGGPLDVLALRRFALPARVFAVSGRAGAANAQPGPPPLPASAVAAAKNAAVSLPQGAVPGVQ